MPDTIYDQEWDDERQQYVSSRKSGRLLGPNAPHYPNSSERAMLRNLMRKGRCSEEEVRAQKGNRQKLAEAARDPQRPGTTDRRALKMKRHARSVAKREGTPIWEAQARIGLIKSGGYW